MKKSRNQPYQPYPFDSFGLEVFKFWTRASWSQCSCRGRPPLDGIPQTSRWRAFSRCAIKSPATGSLHHVLSSWMNIWKSLLRHEAELSCGKPTLVQLIRAFMRSPTPNTVHPYVSADDSCFFCSSDTFLWRFPPSSLRWCFYVLSLHLALLIPRLLRN